MIEIKKPKDCTGCWACYNICPKSCIDMVKDDCGFKYPRVDKSKCIDCKLCEKVCPVINQNTPKNPLNAYCGKNNDHSIQLASSSGGVFTALASKIINDGGVVFGATFNDKWEVVHNWTDTIGGIAAFRGSKYVQSIIGTTFSECEDFLKQGRKVLFSGTPCQIAGLKRYLRKDYDNLITVDFICHGVPSPLVWEEYLKNLTPRPTGADAGKNTVFSSLKDKPSIEGISFRDKRLGWEKFGFSVLFVATNGSDKNSVFPRLNDNAENENSFFEEFRQNIYMKGFLKNLYLRPSCYHCPAKSGKSHSDITLGDFWGMKSIEPEYYDRDGVSLIFINTSNPLIDVLLHDISLKLTNFSRAIKVNTAWYKSSKETKQVKRFWKLFKTQSINCIGPIVSTIKPDLIHRIYIAIRKCIKKI